MHARSRTSLFSIVIALVLGTTCANAQIKDASIQTIDGRSFSGTINQIDTQGMLIGLETSVNLNEVSNIQMKATSGNQSAPGPVAVYLLGGSCVRGNQVELEQEYLKLRQQSGVIKLPLSILRGITWGTSPSEKVTKMIRQPDGARDRVVVEINGNIVSRDGLLESLSVSDIGFEYQGKSRKIGMSKVRGLVMADLGLKLQDGLPAKIRTRNQDLWVGVIESADASQLKISFREDAKISLAVDQIQSIEIVSDRLVYLSDIEPESVEETSQFVIQRKFKADQSVAGNPMRVLGIDSQPKSLNKGLGVQATSELTFKNSGFDRLQGIIGIDLETRGRGHCVATVMGDGIRLWEQSIAGGQPAKPLDVDINGIQKITLLVAPGPEFDLSDHLDWGEIRLLKTR